MSRRGWRRLAPLAAGIAVGSAALAACSTPDPTPPPVSSSTPPASSSSTSTTAPPTTSTSSTTTAASDIPEAARANTADGAVAFTSYFAAVANAAFSGLDPSKIQRFSNASCKTCSAMVQSITQWRDAGYTYEGKFVDATGSSIASFPTDGTAKTLLSGNGSEARVLDKNGAVVQQFSSPAATSSFSLLFQDGQWRISEIQRAT